MTVSNPLQNLFIDVQGSTQGVIPGGEPIQRIITVHNRGERTAEIELWLEPTNLRAKPLLRWSSFDKADSELLLAPNQQVEVLLSFVTPLQAEPGFYSYEIRARSPQYPEEEAHRSQQLQVLPPEQETRRTDPQISLTPVTDSIHPYQLRPNAELTVAIAVDNPSLRTDRFFATCPDLPSDWFTVEYPENEGGLPGLVTQTNGLQLNPQESGDIKLRIHPPAHALAGNYFPTIRVTSSNHPDIALLEILYLTIPVDDRLTLTLTPRSRKFPATDDFFEVLLDNPGNIERDLLLTAQDEERKFKYAITPNQVHLNPGESNLSQIQPRPRHRWRQLWRLRNQTIEFDIKVHNANYVLPVTDPALKESEKPVDKSLLLEPFPQPQLPETTPLGKIFWQARRRWLFWLLVVALGLGLFTIVTFLIWYYLFWRPSLRPQITQFAPAQETYQEAASGSQTSVALDWNITNLNKIDAIELILRPEAEQSVRGRRYELNQAEILIPRDLEPYCQAADAESANSILANLLRIYRRIRTDSANALVLQCRGVVVENWISLTEAEAEAEAGVSPGRSEFVFSEGTYEITLRVDAQAEGSFAQETTEVVVGPPPPPKIVTLTATANEYSLVTSDDIVATEPALPIDEPDAEALDAMATSNLMNGETTRDRTTAGTPETRPFAPIRLNWEITNLADIAELKLFSLAPNGSENVPAETFDFRNGIPTQLQPYCQALENQLICNQVPTTATEVDEYVFYLSVTPTDDTEAEEIIASTATIPIKPPSPKIMAFALDGEPVSERPKRVLVVNPARGSLDLQLNWEVQDATQVELLPAPGIVQGNALTYTVSAAPGSETITLRAINELEEEVTQTVVVEKVGYDSPRSATADSARDGGASSPGQVLPPPPLPSVVPVPFPPTPSRLPPAEEPPRAN
jgi:hypothetical protein